MLSREDNELLTRVGPATLMGRGVIGLVGGAVLCCVDIGSQSSIPTSSRSAMAVPFVCDFWERT